MNFPRTAALTLLLLGISVGATKPVSAPPSDRAAQCASNADCVITEFSGCCGGCCPSARAMAKADLQRAQQRCSVIDCEAPMCAAVVCEKGPSAASLRAACVENRCVAQPVGGAAPGECSSDRECTVIYPEPGPNDACRRSACGCCPGRTPVAVPVSRAEESDARPQRRAPQPQPSAQPSVPPPDDGKSTKFGLSKGGAVDGPPAPNCAACQAPEPARAACRANRCVLLQMNVPIPPT